MPKKMAINHSLQKNHGRANNAYCINHAYQGKVSTTGSKKKYKHQCKLLRKYKTKQMLSNWHYRQDVKTRGKCQICNDFAKNLKQDN